MPADRLDPIRKALARKEVADREYREALEEVVAAGGSYAEIGRLLGVSRQAVRQYLERGERS